MMVDTDPSTERPFVPGQRGGTLIRQAIGTLKKTDFFDQQTGSHILIACSAGADSVALARLIGCYGQRVTGQGQIKIVLVNFDHGWRSQDQAAAEAELVRTLSQEIGAEFRHQRLEPDSDHGLEAAARRARYTALELMAYDYPDARIFTAHHREDQAETVLKRLLTGQLEQTGGGILRQWGRVYRPLLEASKPDLQAFLEEENQSFLEDPSNLELRFERNRLRSELFPELLRHFPRAVEHLSALAGALQPEGSDPRLDLPDLIRARIRRPASDSIRQLERSPESGRVDLPDGWVAGRRESGKNHDLAGLTLGKLIPSLDAKGSETRRRQAVEYLVRVLDEEQKGNDFN
jgi:tRNA(Ile)-lysidine synthase